MQSFLATYRHLVTSHFLRNILLAAQNARPVINVVPCSSITMIGKYDVHVGI